MHRPLNILFFLPDQHRWDWMPANEDLPLRMPNIYRLMRNGTTFTHAYTPSPVCAPARACLAAGREYRNCGVPSNKYDYPLDQPTYYQALRDSNYEVMGVGKFDLHKATLDWGIDGSRHIHEWGFTCGIDNEGKFDGSGSYRQNGKPMGPYLKALQDAGWADKYVAEHKKQHREATKGAYVTCLPDELYCDTWLAENGLRLLANQSEHKPWHLVVNFTGPHNPMEVTHSMHERWKNTHFPLPHNNEQPDWSPEDHQRNRQHYAAMLENIDHQIGRYLDLLEERGELDNTLIVFSSDHGEMLGDHGLWGKSVWREPSVHIPLVIAGSELRQGAVDDNPVALHDLTATFLDAAGASPLPAMESMSLLPRCRGEDCVFREWVNIALGDWKAVTDGDWKLVALPEQAPMLFDLRNDPHEDNDLASSSPEKVKYWRERLA